MTTKTHTDETYYALWDTMERFFGRNPYQLAAQLPDVSASPEEISRLEYFQGIQGREAYLAWVKDYKALVKQAADLSRALKADRRSQHENVQAQAQERLHMVRTKTTLAIHLRRLGKIWSAAQARALRDEAA